MKYKVPPSSARCSSCPPSRRPPAICCRPCSAPWPLGLFASSSSGSKVVKGGIKGVLPVSVLGGLVGIFIIVMLPIGILTSYVLWKKGRIQVVDKEQK